MIIDLPEHYRSFLIDEVHISTGIKETTTAILTLKNNKIVNPNLLDTDHSIGFAVRPFNDAEISMEINGPMVQGIIRGCIIVQWHWDNSLTAEINIDPINHCKVIPSNDGVPIGISINYLINAFRAMVKISKISKINITVDP